MGQEVMVVASDEGPLNAALCTFELLICAPYIKEIIFAGSAGFSSQVQHIYFVVPKFLSVLLSASTASLSHLISTASPSHF